MTSSTLRNSLLCLACALTTGSFGLNQTQANALAQYALSRTSLAGGVVSLPRCGTGELALAFAQNGSLMTHAMASQDADVATARGLVWSAGLLGRRAWVEKGVAASLPYADNFVDLLIIADLTDATMPSVSGAEVQRVLRPGGLALVGRASAEGSGLALATVQGWGSTLSNATAESNGQGVWAVLTKLRPAGADDWPSRWHGPDNNPLSYDAAARYPFLPQWRAKPYNIGNTGAAVSSGGRLLSSMMENGARILRVYRIYNGQPLWSRPLSRDWPNTSVNPTLMTVSGDRFYIVNTSGVVVINAETGAVLDTIHPDNLNPTGYVKWIGIAGNRLYALVGDASSFTTGTGATIACYDLAGNTTVWRRVESQPIGWCDMAVYNGGVFFYAANTRIACLEAATGGVRWENTTASILSGYQGSGSVATDPGLVCFGTTVFACRTSSNAMAALSTVDGHALWTRGGGRDWRQVIADDKIFSRGAGVLSCATGAATSIAANMGDGCGAVSATTQGIFGQNGGLRYLLNEQRNITSFIGSYGKKSSCDMMPVFAEGIWVTPLTGCQCYCLHRGLLADVGAGSFVFDRAAVQSERLEQGPAYSNLNVQVVPDGQDWSTHRANNSHSANLAVSVTPSPALRYRVQPAVPFVYTTSSSLTGAFDPATEEGPTPPVSVGDRVFWAGSDGVVHCYNSALPGEEWRFVTGGRVYATPAVADGCVYVGSGDGYAYCIEAHTGRLVWRFRAAPVDRRISLYGQLVSSWPLLGGVLVQSGVAYTVAGFSSEFGVHAYALNAATGAIVWQNNTCGKYAGAVDHDGPTPGGYMTIVGSKLWARAAFKRNLVFDLATGALEPVPAAMTSGDDIWVTVRGREIGAIDSRHVVFGGMPMFTDPNERTFGGVAQRFVLRYCAADAQGVPMHPEIEPPTMVAPTASAWDSRNYYNYRIVEIANTYTLERWDHDALVSYIDTRRAGATLSRPYVAGEDWNTGVNPPTVWRRATNEVNGIRDIYPDGLALASNRLVAVYSRTHNGLPAAWPWYLGLLDTANGQNTWEVQLPSMPLHDGVALGRNGDIYVMLQSGDLLCYGGGPVVSVLDLTPLPPSPTEGGLARAVTSPANSPAGSLTVVAPAGPVAAVPPAPALVILTPAAYDASRDSSDIKVTDDIARHTVAPFERQQAAGYHPRDMRWRPDVACLPVASVRASAGNADVTVDCNLATRWAPATGGQQWVTYDLGSVRQVASLSLVWYSAQRSRTPFTVEASLDGRRFEPVDQGTLAGRGTNTTVRSFVPVAARFVRVAFAEQPGPSIYEVGIHAPVEQQVSTR